MSYDDWGVWGVFSQCGGVPVPMLVPVGVGGKMFESLITALFPPAITTIS
jgi:hypothetical protein